MGSGASVLLNSQTPNNKTPMSYHVIVERIIQDPSDINHFEQDIVHILNLKHNIYKRIFKTQSYINFRLHVLHNLRVKNRQNIITYPAPNIIIKISSTNLISCCSTNVFIVADKQDETIYTCLDTNPICSDFQRPVKRKCNVFLP
jgi:hypothetical protein